MGVVSDLVIVGLAHPAFRAFAEVLSAYLKRKNHTLVLDLDEKKEGRRKITLRSEGPGKAPPDATAILEILEELHDQRRP